MEHLLETASERRVLPKMAKRYREVYYSKKSLQFQRRDVAKESVCFCESFHKMQYCTYKKFFIHARKKKQNP